MEKLQGPINPSLITEDFEVGNWLEEFISSTTAANFKFEDPYNNNTSTTDEGAYYYNINNNNNNVEAPHYTLPSLEDKMPFLQMLQSVEATQLHQQHQQFLQLEPNFQFLLKLQHQKITCFTNPEINDSNHSNIIMDLHSEGVKSENDYCPQKLPTEEQVETQKCNTTTRSKRNNNNNTKLLKCSSSSSCRKEKRKRKGSSTKPVKNKEEVETQRMTHIAVERNRRRQMNEHLNALRSLMPPSYVQRGDQASIIGGAIDFVKELEQMLQSLQAQKKMRQFEENGDVSRSNNNSSSSSSLNLYSSNTSFRDSSPFHQLQNQVHIQEETDGNENLDDGVVKGSNNDQEYCAEKKSALADIEVVVIQNHVNLKIQCQRKAGQLLKAIVAFEELRLTVLHLNITSLHTLVHYSFNLKIEDDCNLGSADEVARVVHQIFSLINLN